jgi:MFS family permease
MPVIDRLGRRTLLLTGSVGTAVRLAGVASIFNTGQHENLLLWLLVGYIASFAFSQGAVIWVYLAEVFPNTVRAKGQSLGSFSHWFMNALISFTFPQMAASSRAYPFVFFSVMMIVRFFVVLFVYPETKDVTLEQMQRKMGIAQPQFSVLDRNRISPDRRFECAGNRHPILRTPRTPLVAGDQEWRYPAVRRAPFESLEAIAQRTLPNKFPSSKRPATGMGTGRG